MPIEIKELHIHVVVNASPTGQSGQTPQTGTVASSDTSSHDKDSIVAECVEQVLDILQNKRER